MRSVIPSSTYKPGGENLCQEAPRLVLILTQNICEFNVNLSEKIVGEGATA
jgi:hypothetical protein